MQVERNKLSGSSQEDAVNTLCLSISQYLDTLAPVMKVDESVQLPDLPSNVMSLNIIKTKSLAEQVEIVIKDGKVGINLVSFKALLIGAKLITSPSF